MLMTVSKADGHMWTLGVWMYACVYIWMSLNNVWYHTKKKIYIYNLNITLNIKTTIIIITKMSHSPLL